MSFFLDFRVGDTLILSVFALKASMCSTGQRLKVQDWYRELFNWADMSCSISIGNHIISPAIWNKQALVNFSKTSKSYGLMHFVVFEKFTSAYLFQIAREKLCDYLVPAFTRSIYKKCTAILKSGE